MERSPNLAQCGVLSVLGRRCTKIWTKCRPVSGLCCSLRDSKQYLSIDILYSPRLLPQTHVEFQSFLLREFFSRSELSDITSAKYFRVKGHIAMINITLSSLTWRVLSKGRRELKCLISGAAIRWINRQLVSLLYSTFDTNSCSSTPRLITTLEQPIISEAYERL